MFNGNMLLLHGVKCLMMGKCTASPVPRFINSCARGSPYQHFNRTHLVASQDIDVCKLNNSIAASSDPQVDNLLPL